MKKGFRVPYKSSISEKCPRVPAWHPSDSDYPWSHDIKSIKTHCGTFTARLDKKIMLWLPDYNQVAHFYSMTFFFTFIAIPFIISIIIIIIIIYIYIFSNYLFRNTMYDCKAPLSRFYYPDTRRIINAFIIIIINATL